MDIRELFPVRTHYSRSGGSTSLPPEHSLLWRENQLQHVRELLTRDREAVLIDGPITPAIQAILDEPPREYRACTREELDELNGK